LSDWLALPHNLRDEPPVGTPMNCMVTGLSKSGTTILFASIRDSFPRDRECFFEPTTAAEFEHIVSRGLRTNTLTKALLGNLVEHSHVITRFDTMVLIVRDPRDQFISQMLYQFYRFKVRGDRAGYECARDLLRRKIESPSTVSTIQLYDTIASLAGRHGSENLAKRYDTLVRFREQYRPHTVRYEDFVDRKSEGLEGLAQYLGMPVSIASQVDDEHRRVVRTKTHGEWRAWLTAEDLEFINRGVAESMRALDYPVVSSVESPAPIPVATTLEYVEQFRPGEP
jgi:hypothetical protein